VDNFFQIGWTAIPDSALKWSDKAGKSPKVYERFCWENWENHRNILLGDFPASHVTDYRTVTSD